jgi:hypothetical protein
MNSLSQFRPTHNALRSGGLGALAGHARHNVATGNALRNDDGSLSTVRSGSVNHPKLNGGMPTLIPFIWDGEYLGEEDATRRAIESGRKWPKFKTHDEATKHSIWLSDQLPTSKEGWREFKGLTGTP